MTRSTTATGTGATRRTLLAGAAAVSGASLLPRRAGAQGAPSISA
jgi:hypothetical protein